MSNLTQSNPIQPPHKTFGLGLISIFTSSIFLSASLLFAVQPMFAKLALPLLGGASNVWNTAMVFFQGTLLLGYLYAHLLAKYFRLHWQVIIHFLVMAVGFVFLPLAIASGWSPPEEGVQAVWLIGLFGVSIGVPFFAISANAPLLQHWFSKTGHKDARDPYFLYAASNCGSLLSLCLYPILFEPLLRLQEQTQYWSWGYIILIAVLLLTGMVATRRNLKTSDSSEKITAPIEPLSWYRRGVWITLAFVPSSLMLGVTSHMTNNIASAPFLWVAPLALYLVTFIIVFASRPLVTSAQIGRLFPWVIFLAIVAGFVIKNFIILSIGLSLVTYFLIALMCHSRLAEARPGVSRLTEFYIFISLGGVLGGIFNALIAPAIFDGTYEYLVVLLLSYLVLPREKEAMRIRFKSGAILMIGALVAYVIFLFFRYLGVPMQFAALIGGLSFVYTLTLVQSERKFAITNIIVLLGLVVGLPPLLEKVGGKNILQTRSFFGVISVRAIDTPYGEIHRFDHGDTIHNYQFRDEKLRKIPLAYYSIGNSFDRALKAVRSRSGNVSLAMIGLGAGAMACYEQPGDDWTYFEIDPEVVKMAKNPEYFSYMADCSIESDIRIGDARLTLKHLEDDSLDMIIVDAFSSDSIPTHLVTREAMSLYRQKLKANGMMFFHTSNRVMDVASVVVRLGEDAGLDSRYISLNNFKDQPFPEFHGPSRGVMVGSQEDIRNTLSADKDWVVYEPSPYVGTWSDDYSSVIGTIIGARTQRKKYDSTFKPN